MILSGADLVILSTLFFMLWLTENSAINQKPWAELLCGKTKIPSAKKLIIHTLTPKLTSLETNARLLDHTAIRRISYNLKNFSTNKWLRSTGRSPLSGAQHWKPLRLFVSYWFHERKTMFWAFLLFFQFTDMTNVKVSQCCTEPSQAHAVLTGHPAFKRYTCLPSVVIWTPAGSIQWYIDSYLLIFHSKTAAYTCYKYKFEVT